VVIVQIGSVTVILEAGFKEAHEGENEVVIEVPAGVVKAKAMYHNGKVTSVTFTNVTAFVYKENLETKLDNYNIPYTISFGGSFFALIDTRKIPGFPEINQKSSRFYLDLGMKLLTLLNEKNKGKIKHPTLDITTIDLIEF